MGRISEALEKHAILLLDTIIWIYHFEEHPDYGAAAGEILSTIADGRCKALMSELSLMEVVTGPLRMGRQDIADEYELLLSSFPNLELWPVTRSVLLKAADIRARHGFKTPDAVILATAAEAGASLVVTNASGWSNFQDVRVLCLNATDFKAKR